MVQKRSSTTPRSSGSPTAVGTFDHTSPASVGSNGVAVVAWSPVGDVRATGPIAGVGGRHGRKQQQQHQQRGRFHWFVLICLVLMTVFAVMFLNWKYYQLALYQREQGKQPASDDANGAPMTIMQEGKTEQSAAAAEEIVIDAASGRRTSSPRCKGRFVSGLDDILHCYPQEGRTLALAPDCRSIKTWEDVKRCLNGKRATPNVDEGKEEEELEEDEDGVVAYEVHVIGERNSGTKFITGQLQQCFERGVKYPVATRTSRDKKERQSDPKKEGEGGESSSDDGSDGGGNGSFVMVRAHRDFYRGKHWFQPVGEFAQYANTTRYRRRIVIAIFRNPMDWLAAMHEKPYHSPHHVASFDTEEGRPFPIPWMDFLTRPWTMVTPNGTAVAAAKAKAAQPLAATATGRRSVDFVGGGVIGENRDYEEFGGGECSHMYHEEEVVPCGFGPEDNQELRIPRRLVRGYAPTYEMRRDGSGLPYDSVVDLRSDKIVNFALEVPVLVPHLHGYLAVRYEDLVTQGTGVFLSQFADLVGLDLPRKCKLSPPQDDRIGQRPIPDDVRQWINRHLNNDTERLLGYGS